ncbi:M20/M25/M40 family metallo-hydrolase [uncultured Dokdonia sp.]|uniref:M20/M25/M40 family metallo-hydrolase n=1 Tax=uncultured Dokdonia sp. TaxID=575653 RepID=UPI0026171B12|nr:M20/M25/M40 family metallo-hydrolase [uncultured Dokdonia sp.]
MKTISIYLFLFIPFLLLGQNPDDVISTQDFKNTLLLHKEFVSIPNLPENKELMLQNIQWVAQKYDNLDFETTLLETSTLPILIAEKEYNPNYKTVLFYFHIDGQPINPDAWDQDHPFTPVLKEKDKEGTWQPIDWKLLEGDIDDEWRIFARAAADDKAPIIMLLSALNILKTNNNTPKFNIKVIFDPEEEYGSTALLSTLDTYKDRYASDYFIVMDGPAHTTNKPTVTFGCRGIATCAITTYGSKVPQHSGHYGNYVPNPVFSLSRLLASMKDDHGKVLIEDYYKGIDIDPTVFELLASVPFDAKKLNQALGIHSSEQVGRNYQESLQYPSLNVRQIGTSWKGKGLKTVIPEYATANIDVRLVPETDGEVQLQKIKRHIQQQGYYVIDRDPTDAERLNHPKIAKFTGALSVNAFRTNPDADFGKKIRNQLKEGFGEDPIVIRLMGGTVPIIPLINTLNVPTVIIPMVNMDNNQHSPNENIRIGNIRQGIYICLAILNSNYE